ncbi:MAG: KOW domain-containing RNA-binding protein [Ruminiclostridium sp.]|nr:KOW domain-containing RNA-binding protein [Ruminiclostridium sp.]
MELAKGTVVISRAGRDKGYPLAVVGLEGKFVLVADGKERPLSRPKKKNPMHLAVTDKTVEVEGVSDKALRNALKKAVNVDQKPNDNLQECE